jgi:hypothetical protein
VYPTVVFGVLHVAVTSTPNAVISTWRSTHGSICTGSQAAKAWPVVVGSHIDAKDRCTHLVRNVQQPVPSQVAAPAAATQHGTSRYNPPPSLPPHPICLDLTRKRTRLQFIHARFASSF